MKRSVIVLSLVVLTLVWPNRVAGQGNAGNPNVLPSLANAYGKTYGEWSADWWRWTYSMPTTNHPLFDTADCSAGQSGKVWFLGGTYSPGIEENGVVIGRVDRECIIPPGYRPVLPHPEHRELLRW